MSVTGASLINKYVFDDGSLTLRGEESVVRRIMGGSDLEIYY